MLLVVVSALLGILTPLSSAQDSLVHISAFRVPAVPADDEAKATEDLVKIVSESDISLLQWPTHHDRSSNFDDILSEVNRYEISHTASYSPRSPDSRDASEYGFYYKLDRFSNIVMEYPHNTDVYPFMGSFTTRTADGGEARLILANFCDSCLSGYRQEDQLANTVRLIVERSGSSHVALMGVFEVDRLMSARALSAHARMWLERNGMSGLLLNDMIDACVNEQFVNLNRPRLNYFNEPLRVVIDMERLASNPLGAQTGTIDLRNQVAELSLASGTGRHSHLDSSFSQSPKMRSVELEGATMSLASRALQPNVLRVRAFHFISAIYSSLSNIVQIVRGADIMLIMWSDFGTRSVDDPILKVLNTEGSTQYGALYSPRSVDHTDPVEYIFYYRAGVFSRVEGYYPLKTERHPFVGRFFIRIADGGEKPLIFAAFHGLRHVTYQTDLALANTVKQIYIDNQNSPFALLGNIKPHLSIRAFRQVLSMYRKSWSVERQEQALLLGAMAEAHMKDQDGARMDTSNLYSFSGNVIEVILDMNKLVSEMQMLADSTWNQGVDSSGVRHQYGASLAAARNSSPEFQLQEGVHFRNAGKYTILMSTREQSSPSSEEELSSYHHVEEESYDPLAVHPGSSSPQLFGSASSHPSPLDLTIAGPISSERLAAYERDSTRHAARSDYRRGRAGGQSRVRGAAREGSVDRAWREITTARDPRPNPTVGNQYRGRLPPAMSIAQSETLGPLAIHLHGPLQLDTGRGRSPGLTKHEEQRRDESAGPFNLALPGDGLTPARPIGPRQPPAAVALPTDHHIIHQQMQMAAQRGLLRAQRPSRRGRLRPYREYI